MGQFNTGMGLAGAGAGAMSGFGMGGIPGGIAGGLLGGMAGFGGEGQKDEFKQFDQYTPEQQQLLQQILQSLSPQGQLGQGQGQAMSGLQDFMDPSSEAMSRFADPYMQQFQQETVPGLAERFAGAGALGGGLSSSGFGQALSSAGGNLQTQLASMKTGLQRQAIGDIMNQYQGMSGQALGAQPFGYKFQPGGPSAGQSAMTGYAQAGFPGMQQGFSALGDWWKGSGGGQGAAQGGPGQGAARFAGTQQRGMWPPPGGG